MKFEKDEDEDNIDAQVKVGAKRIASETKSLSNDLKNYTKADKDNIFNSNLMLLNRLSYMSKNLHSTLPSAVIKNMIISVLTSNSTMLQIALALVGHYKGIIEHSYVWVYINYHEARRFNVSVAASNNDHFWRFKG